MSGRSDFDVGDEEAVEDVGSGVGGEEDGAVKVFGIGDGCVTEVFERADVVDSALRGTPQQIRGPSHWLAVEPLSTAPGAYRLRGLAADIDVSSAVAAV